MVESKVKNVKTDYYNHQCNRSMVEEIIEQVDLDDVLRPTQWHRIVSGSVHYYHLSHGRIYDDPRYFVKSLHDR